MSTLESAEPKRRRRLWIPVAITLLVIGSMVGFAVYKGMQPKYGFLAGITPIYAGDPYKEMAARMPAGSFPAGQQPPSMYYEVYSFQGDFDQWKKKMQPELQAAGAVLQPSYEEQMKDELAKMNPKQRKEMESSLQELPRTATWEFKDSTPSQAASIWPANSTIYLADATRLTSKDEIFRPSGTPGQHKGWVSVMLLHAEKPTFFSKISGWVKGIFNKP